MHHNKVKAFITNLSPKGYSFECVHASQCYYDHCHANSILIMVNQPMIIGQVTNLLSLPPLLNGDHVSSSLKRVVHTEQKVVNSGLAGSGRLFLPRGFEYKNGKEDWTLPLVQGSIHQFSTGIISWSTLGDCSYPGHGHWRQFGEQSASTGTSPSLELSKPAQAATKKICGKKRKRSTIHCPNLEPRLR